MMVPPPGRFAALIRPQRVFVLTPRRWVEEVLALQAELAQAMRLYVLACFEYLLNFTIAYEALPDQVAGLLKPRNLLREHKAGGTSQGR